jgi:hypothetical protein
MWIQVPFCDSRERCQGCQGAARGAYLWRLNIMKDRSTPQETALHPSFETVACLWLNTRHLRFGVEGMS